MDLPSVPIPDGHPRIYPTLSALWAVGFTVMKGTRRPSIRKLGVPSRKGKQPLTPQEQALCAVVVDVLLQRHRERRARASVETPGGSVRKAGKPAIKQCD